jgi:hypothetical protein
MFKICFNIIAPSIPRSSSFFLSSISTKTVGFFFPKRVTLETADWILVAQRSD